MVISMYDEQKDMSGMLSLQDGRENEDILITPKIVNTFLRNHGLNKELRKKHLFSFGIGAAITGFFVQWNLGLGMAGPFGMLLAMTLSFFIYLTFFRVVAWFSANFPYAGGPYAYARQGLGNFGGYLAGVSTTIQFICASALVLIIIRRYISLIYPDLPGSYFVLAIFCLLVIIHLSGILYSAMVQIFLTAIALSGIILFFLGSSQAINISNFQIKPVFPYGLQGVLAALPTAMWFYLGIEGITMSAEETTKPQRDLPISLITCLAFAAITSLGVWYFGTGALFWPLLTNADFPLLFIVSKVQNQDKILFAIFSFINLVVFFTGLHSLINGYSRQVYALSRAGYFPQFLSIMRPNGHTPWVAVIIPGLVSILVSYIGSYKTITTITLFSAMFMYLLVIVSFLRIRKSKQKIFYKDKPPCSPILLWTNIILLLICQFALLYSNPSTGWIILAAWSVIVFYFYLFARKGIRNDAPEESAAVTLQNKVRIQFR